MNFEQIKISINKLISLKIDLIEAYYESAHFGNGSIQYPDVDLTDSEFYELIKMIKEL